MKRNIIVAAVLFVLAGCVFTGILLSAKNGQETQVSAKTEEQVDIKAYGVKISVPVKMEQTDKETENGVNWISFGSDRDDYLVVQKSQGNSVKDEMMSYIYPDGDSVIITGSFENTDFKNGKTGYRVKYLREKEEYTCIGFKKGNDIIIVDYNSAGSLGDLSKAIDWQE